MSSPRMPVVSWVASQGGVCHTRAIRAAGYSEYQVAEAVRRDAVRRVRRSWLVTQDCDPGRVCAASVGGRLTCVSAAERMGLWTPSSGELHVAVPHGASRHDASGIRLHWSAAPVPVARTVAEEPVINVLFHVARCLPRVDALAVWESALRTGRTDAAVLGRVHWHSSAAAALAGIASLLSDSGLETHFVALLRAAGVAVRQQVWIDGHPVDTLIGERLVVQLDGFAHHRDARDRRRDLRADARLALRGYTVFRFDYQQVLFDSDEVLNVIMTAMAQGIHRAQ